MAKEERTETDGITQTTHLSFRVDGPISRAESEELAAALKRTIQNSSFESKIRALEPELQRETTRTGTPRYGSRGYYAREMLQQIGRVRLLRDLNSRGGVDAALSAAMAVGFLAAESWAKHDWPAVRIGADAQRHQRTRSAKGVQARKEKRATFIDAVSDYFERHPTHSNRTAARNLSSFRRGSGEKAIAALAKRIKRAR